MPTTNDGPAQGTLAWLQGRSLPELHAIEAGGRVLFPDAFRQRMPDGSEKLTPCMVCPPDKLSRAKARIDAIKLVASLRPKQMGSVETWTLAKAQEAIGADVFEDFDTYAMIARCCYELDGVTQAYMLEVLLGSFQPPTIHDMMQRLEVYAALMDPRVGELTEEQFWIAVKGVARAGNLTPLVAMQPETQRAFTIEQARRLQASQTPPSSSTSSPTSTPEP